MVANSQSGQVVFSSDGSSVTFQPRLPHRGIGGFMVFMSLLGVLIIVCAIMIWRDPRPGRDPATAPFFLVFGVVTTLAFLLPGLYFLTRRRLVHLDRNEVAFEKGWCLSRSWRRHALSEFLGMRRFAREVSGVDAATVAGAVVGVAAAAVTGVGAVFTKTSIVHFLQLVHRHDRSLDVLLACDQDGSAVHALMAEMAECFSLNVLDPTLDGFTVRGPAELGRSIADQDEASLTLVHKPVSRATAPPDTAALAPPAGRHPATLPTHPPRMTVQKTGRSTTILLPRSSKPLVAGICIAGAMFLICIVAVVIGAGKEDASEMGLAIIPLLLGAGILAIGIVNSRRRSKMTLGPAGVSLQAAVMGSTSEFLSWKSIEHVTVATEPKTRKPGLLVVTDAADRWAAIGLRVEELNWLRLAILASACESATPNQQVAPDGGEAK